MKTLFISDLHLRPERTDIQTCFTQFVHNCLSSSKDIEALYILGDLFEVWIGDDASIPVYQQTIKQLKQLSDSGIKVYIMHGNRDFLMASVFAQTSGCTLIPDPYPIELLIDNKKQTILLSHGDIFCTDDKEYMHFRNMVRNPLWQEEFLAKTVTKRINIASAMRQHSQLKHTAEKDQTNLVDQEVVEQLMLKYRSAILIHGHTHQSAVHKFQLHSQSHNASKKASKKMSAKRIVLPDWTPNADVFQLVHNKLK